MQKNKVKATIYLPEDVHHRLKLQAVEVRSSMTDLVLQAIEELLARPLSVSAARQGHAQTPNLTDR